MDGAFTPCEAPPKHSDSDSFSPHDSTVGTPVIPGEAVGKLRPRMTRPVGERQGWRYLLPLVVFGNTGDISQVLFHFSGPISREGPKTGAGVLRGESAPSWAGGPRTPTRCVWRRREAGRAVRRQPQARAAASWPLEGEPSVGAKGRAGTPSASHLRSAVLWARGWVREQLSPEPGKKRGFCLRSNGGAQGDGGTHSQQCPVVSPEMGGHGPASRERSSAILTLTSAP